MAKAKATKIRAVAADRQLQACRLRAAGASLDQIAESLGYANRAGAWKAVQRGIELTPAAGVEELRAVENQRLDELQVRWWQQAMTDEKAAKVVLKIIEQRVRLNGLAAPIRADVTVTELGGIDHEVRELVSEMQARDEVLGKASDG